MLNYSLPRLTLVASLVLPACATLTVDDNFDDGSENRENEEENNASGGSTVVVSSGGSTSSGGGLIGSTGGASTASGGSTTASGGSSSGGMSSGGSTSNSGGSTASGGSASGGSVGSDDCPDVPFNMNSGSVGTLGYACFDALTKPTNSWGAYNCQGRTITINGEVIAEGNINWPGTAPYLVEFSAGQYDYCSFSYY